MTSGRSGNGVRPKGDVSPTRPSARRVYVMVGAPGAGKGTQAQLLSEALGLPHIASGDLFREALASEGPLGRAAKKYIERGALVPDDVTVRMIADRLDQPDAKQGAILDGFPRTVPQAKALDALLAKQGARVEGALYIDVKPEELVRRLGGRWVCTGPDQHVYHQTLRPPKKRGVCDIDGSKLTQRSDDEPQTVLARLEKQLPPMYEVIDHYADKGVLVAIPGERPIDEVTKAIIAAIDHAAAQPVS